MSAVTSTVLSLLKKRTQAPTENIATGVLPPCRVCGEKASGFHYGANTCEACKGFFRRSLARNVRYQCTFKNECEISPGKRNICASCRYTKCIAAGMSKSAIKTGRYTHEKRTRDIEEVRQLEKEIIRRDGSMLSLPVEIVNKLDEMIDAITVVHLDTTPQSKQFFASLPEKEQKFMERRMLREQIFGTMKLISREEYEAIFQSTGIDIDGRRELVANMIPTIEKAIKRFITFAKALPGFKDLPVEDQIALIKASRFHTILLQYSHLINQDLGTAYSPLRNDFVHLDDYQTMFGSPEKVRELLSLVFVAHSLELTPQEQAVMAAISIMSSPITLSHIGWIIRDSVLDELGDALLLLLERSKDNPGVVFGKIISILTELKAIESSSLAAIEQGLIATCPGVAERHKIFCEISGVAKPTVLQ